MTSVVLLRILFLVSSVVQILATGADNEEREKDALADESMKEFLDVDIDCLNTALFLLLGANPTCRFARSICLVEASTILRIRCFVKGNDGDLIMSLRLIALGMKSRLGIMCHGRIACASNFEMIFFKDLQENLQSGLHLYSKYAAAVR